MRNKNRGKRTSLQVFDDFSIDEKELDKIIDKINGIGNINPIPYKDIKEAMYNAEIKEHNL